MRREIRIQWLEILHESTGGNFGFAVDVGFLLRRLSFAATMCAMLQNMIGHVLRSSNSADIGSGAPVGSTVRICVDPRIGLFSKFEN